MKNKSNNQIYVYSRTDTPGYLKIGESSKDASKRVTTQQDTTSNTKDIEYTHIATYDNICFPDGKTIYDHDIHKILEEKFKRERLSIKETKNLPNGQKETKIKKKREWFKINFDQLEMVITSMQKGTIDSIDIFKTISYELRPSQQEAIDKTITFFKKNNNSSLIEMLWNAKMRFGKTYTTYKLAQRLQNEFPNLNNQIKIIIVTYKPAVKDAWEDDLIFNNDFNDFVFFSGESLKNINQYINTNKNIVSFVSFQDLLGRDETDNIKEKHKVLFDINWDLLVFDEFHYGSDTIKSRSTIDIDESEEDIEDEIQELVEIKEQALVYDLIKNKKISSTFKLYLSGTPFRALEEEFRFSEDSIFSWTYFQEQEAKKQWNEKYPDKKDKNPYLSLPEIELHIFELSEKLLNSTFINEKNEFSLNEFFKCDSNGEFKRKDDVEIWLTLISGGPYISTTPTDSDILEKKFLYPYDKNSEFIQKKLINHSMWYFKNVNSAKAMYKLLKAHTNFSDFHPIFVAGKDSKSGANALPEVKMQIEQAKKENKGTIILTVGKLTTGVSIPELSAIFFLREGSSPETFFQTAFRAQTPYFENGKIKKEKCFIFDFSPNRSLQVLNKYSEISSNKNSSREQKESNLDEFIRYLPILKYDGNGMKKVELNEILNFQYRPIKSVKELSSELLNKKNISLSRSLLSSLSINDYDNIISIVNDIKMFKLLNNINLTDNEKKLDSDDVTNNLKKIKNLRTKEKINELDKKELSAAEKDFNKKIDILKETMLVLLSRIPIFMYITDAAEKNIEHLVYSEQICGQDNNLLFKKVTGITLEQLNMLLNLGVLPKGNMSNIVKYFLEFEKENYFYFNSLINK